MKATWLIRTGILCGCVGLLYLAAAFCAEPDASEAKDDKSHCVPVATARDRAKLMHDIYAATLDTMHERYFHRMRHRAGACDGRHLRRDQASIQSGSPLDFGEHEAHEHQSRTQNRV